MLLIPLLSSFIKKGEITIIDPSGTTQRVGNPETGPSVTIRLHDKSLHYKLALNPRLYFGEAYMDGKLSIENGTIYDFLDLVGLNTGTGTLNAMDRWYTKARLLWRYYKQANSLSKARNNAAHHYNLSNDLYDLFLDKHRQYSCAYFTEPDMSLDDAQLAKMKHIAAKLLLEPGQRVLEIGSGWGGLAVYLAKTSGVEITSLTLSEEQLNYARKFADEQGVGDKVKFHLRDYREQTGQFDRIVSIAMLEAVGTPYLGTYFSKVFDLLKDDGVALVHTISHMDEPYPANVWLDKYIFPGGYSPALSEMIPLFERTGLWVTDVEILRLHYAKTLQIWRSRFMDNWDKAAALYDERFCRMWEFYLAASEMVFRRQGHMIAQIQLAKSVDAVPLTRDYITDWDHDRKPKPRKSR